MRDTRGGPECGSCPKIQVAGYIYRVQPGLIINVRCDGRDGHAKVRMLKEIAKMTIGFWKIAPKGLLKWRGPDCSVREGWKLAAGQTGGPPTHQGAGDIYRVPGPGLIIIVR